MEKIVLEGLAFHGSHGAFEEEARFGSRFIVDVELYFKIPDQDELTKTVDYGRVYEVVQQEVTGKRYQLIEILAHQIASHILEAEPMVYRIIARVHKPHAPLPGIFGDVYAEVVRDQNDI